MILYLDTSALIKLYAEESGTEEVRSAVEEAEVVAVSEIGYVEARSALARKEREGSLSREEHDEAVEQLDHDFREVYLLRPVTGEIVVSAGDLTRRHSLRAYDAVHLATALALREEARELALRQRETAEIIDGDGDELRVLLMSYDASLNATAHEENLAYGPEPSSSQ